MRSTSRWPKRSSSGLLTLLLLAASCTGGAEPGDRPSPPAAPERQEAASETFLLGVIGAPATLDPYDPRASDLTYALARPVYPSLFRFLPDGTPQPDLVRRIDKGRRSAVVQLRAARWSDGTPITARDVIASARRASPPSGLAGLEVTARGRRTIRLEGTVPDWERRLATLTFILPRGRARRAYGGPYALARYTEGYEVVLRRNPHHSGPAPLSSVLKVRFVQDLDLLLLLLQRGRLDAAAPPSTVNLDERVEELGLAYDRRDGWEYLWLDFSRSRLNEPERRALSSSVGWRRLAETFVRDEGRLVLSADLLGGSPSLIVNETLIGSNGDELVALLMRAAWFQLRDAGHAIELLRVDPSVLYGEWQDEAPSGVALRRSLGAPGVADPLGLGTEGRRLFEVTSFVVWRDGVAGARANPTWDGPLWNAERLAPIADE